MKLILALLNLCQAEQQKFLFAGLVHFLPIIASIVTEDELYFRRYQHIKRNIDMWVKLLKA